jgi:hypothetical protein
VALEDLQELLESLTTGLEDLQAPLEDLTSLLSSLTSGLDGLKSGSEGAGHALQGAGESAQGVGGMLQKATEGAKVAAEAIRGLGEAAEAMANGPLPSAGEAMSAVGNVLGGAMTGAADKAAEALGKLGPEGEAAGAALQALAEVASATVGTLTTLMGIALEVNEKIDLMSARFEALAGSTAGGEEIFNMVQKLGQELPFATAQIAGWAQGLRAAGVQGKQLEEDIKAVAAATALMGESGGAAAMQLFKRLGEGGPAADKLLKTFQEGGPKADKLLKEMGLSLADIGGAAALSKMSAEQLHEALAKAMEKKGSGPLDAMMNGWPNIIQKAREGFLSLFDALGPAIEPFMAEVKGLFGEFSKGGVVINMLKPIVTSVLSTLFGWATTAFHAIHQGLLFVAVYALKAYIAIRPIVDHIKQLVSSQQFITGLKIAFIALGAAVLIAALPFLFIVASVLAVVAVFGLLVAGAAYVGAMLVAQIGAWWQALSGLASGAVDAASNFIGGLVQGISAGVGAVVDAVKGLASSALGAFTGAFGIRSPSTVMLEHGEENIGGAAATGVDRAQPKMKAAMARLSDGAGAGGKGGARGQGGDDRELHFHYHGPLEDYERFKRYARRFLEETANEAGATPGQA